MDAGNPEHRRTRSSATLTALDVQLREVKETCGVEELVVTDLDGAPVLSAGETEEVIALAGFAAGVVRENPTSRSLPGPRGLVHVDGVMVGRRMLAIAAQSRHGVPSPEGVARAVEGARRILTEGVEARRKSVPPPEK
jgi:hypothetical protein